MSVVLDANGQQFGGVSVNAGGGDMLLQDFTISNGTNVVELEGAEGEVIAQAFIARPEEMSGTAVSDGNGSFTRGDEFSYDGKTWIVTETSQSRSNGSFATQSFTARTKINS